MTTTTSAVLLGTAELAADLGAWAAGPRTGGSWRWTRTPTPTPAGTSPAPWPSTGATTSRTRSAATSSAREAFAALMDRLGVGNDTQVVLYGGNSNWFAAYAYWYFRFYGHQAVRLLDGGRKTWELEGRPLTTEVPAGHARTTATGSRGRRRRSGPCAPRS